MWSLLTGLPLDAQSATPGGMASDVLQVITTRNAAQLRVVTRLKPANVDAETLLFGADSDILYSGGTMTPIEIWDLRTGQGRAFSVRHYGGFAVSPDGKRLAVNSSTDLGGIGLYDLTTGRLLADIPCSGGSYTIRFSPTDNDLLAVGVTSGKPETLLHIWRIKPNLPSGWDEANIARCKPDTWLKVASFYNLTFSPDGRLLLAGDQLLSTTTWQPVASLPNVDKYNPNRVAFSPDSNAVATVMSLPEGKAGLAVWERPWEKLTHAIPFSEVRAGSVPKIETLTFSPDGGLLAMAGYGQAVDDGSPDGGLIWLWDARAYKPIALLPIEGDLPLRFKLTFNPDGKRLVISLFDRILVYGVPKAA
jgi:WD40 repeat protein